MSIRTGNQHGFTLIEMTLAIVIGALVLLGVTGVFAAARTMDGIFSTQYEHSTELHITQMTIRRALLSLQVDEDQRTAPTDSAGVDDSIVEEFEPRSRVILEYDPAYASMPGEWQPQRFEVVVASPPIALDLTSKAAAWARINDRDEDSLDFSSADASGGVMRSVFELRPDGSRERIMRAAGILEQDTKADEAALLSDESPIGWTLWWRPILTTESNYLREGGTPLGDTAGTMDEIRFRLAGAIPLVRDIDVCAWTIYKSDEKVTEYEALTMSSLPAYAEFELLLNSGQYATWMFEIDWVLGDDPLDIVEDDSSAGNGAGGEDTTNGDGNGGGNGNGGGGSGDGSGGGRGGGVHVPDRNNQNNLGNRDN